MDYWTSHEEKERFIFKAMLMQAGLVMLQQKNQHLATCSKSELYQFRGTQSANQ